MIRTAASSRLSRFRASLRRRSGGAAALENAMLLVVVAIPIIIGVTVAGVTLLQHYRESRHLVLLPTP